VPPGSAVLVKASRLMRLERVAEALVGKEADGA
jgi:UDP-N-acetylmuramyl pentapeptide synthase